MAEKTTKLIIEILSRGGAKVAADVSRILKDTERSAAQTDRVIEQSNKTRLSQQTKAQKQAADDFIKNLKRVEAEEKQVSAGFSKLGSNISGAISKVSSAISSVGGALTGALTVPLLALGSLGTKAALDLDQIRTKITALVGDASSADAKIKELRNLADNSVGLTQKAALEGFAQFKGIGGIADETINRLIASMGKLNAAFNIDDLPQFNRNLVQIFSQSFERADIKEAIGRVPFFTQLLKQAFGTDDSDKLRKLKESGKLTLESFLNGMSEAISSDPRVSNIGENLTVKLEKSFERLNVALAPVGSAILNIVVPAIEALVPYVQSAFEWFSKLTPAIQTVAVVVGAIVTALGPALLALATAITVIETIGAAIAAVAGALAGVSLAPVIAGAAAVAAAFATLVAGLYVLYEAWQSNFGGIRDLTLQVWEAVKSALSGIYDIVLSIGGAIVGWWQENYPLIQATVENVSGKVQATIQAFLGYVSAFWEEHGVKILGYVRTLWEAVSTFIGAVVTQIGNVVRLGMQIINGDWEGAWGTVLKAFEQISEFIVKNARQLVNLLGKAFAVVVPILEAIWIKIPGLLVGIATKAIAQVVYIFFTLPDRLLELVPKLVRAGTQIGQAIYEGIQKGLAEGAATKANVAIPVVGDSGVLAGVSAGATMPAQSSEQMADSDKARKQREARLKEELSNLQNINKEQIEAQRILFETANRNNEKLLESGGQTFEQYRTEALNNIKNFQAEVSDLMAKGFELSSKGKTGTALEAETLSYKNAVQKFEDEMSRQQEDVNKKASDAQKKTTEQRIKNSLDSLEREQEARERVADRQKAFLESRYAQGLISEEAYQRSLRNLRLRYETAIEEDGRLKSLGGATGGLIDRRDNLKRELDAVKGNADEEKRIKRELADAENAIEVEYYNQKKERADGDKKSREEEKRLAQELLEIKKQLLYVEREVLNFRAEQERKGLENAVENSRGIERVKALQSLRDFEIAEEQRQLNVRLKDLQGERDSSLEKIKGKANEEEQKFQIEELYKQKKLLSEEEFQAKKKEIEKAAEEKKEQEKFDSMGGGLMGGLFGGLGLSVKDMAEPVSILTTLGNQLSQVFQQVAGAVGNAVAAFVKFGTVGGSFRKFAAEVIASIAQMAVIQAVWELAQGLAMSALAWFTGNPKYAASAAAHYSAAAVFGVIGGVAAVAGRVVAGNEFSNNSAQGAFNNQTSQATGGTRGEGGKVFSNYGDDPAVLEVGRNSPAMARQEVAITFKERTGWFTEMFDIELRKNGKLSELIAEQVAR